MDFDVQRDLLMQNFLENEEKEINARWDDILDLIHHEYPVKNLVYIISQI